MLIFCYGSNMLAGRLKHRIASARKIGVAKLYKHVLKFHKVGMDSSGKSDIHYTGNRKDYAWGVVVEIDPAEKQILDEYEDYGKGYSDKIVEVELDTGVRIKVLTYFALKTKPDLKPYDWYKDFVVVGAIENRLPGGYIQYLQEVQSMQDSDYQRSQANREVLYNLQP